MIEPTEIEKDLSRHLRQRIHQILGDFFSTCDAAEVPRVRAMALAILQCVDIGMAGLAVAGFERKDIERIIKARLQIQMVEHLKRRKAKQ